MFSFCFYISFFRRLLLMWSFIMEVTIILNLIIIFSLYLFCLLLVLILVQILPTFYISFKKSQVFWQSMGSGRNVLFTTTFLDDGKNVLALTSKRLLDFVCVKLFDWKKISLYRDGVILPLSVIKMILKFGSKLVKSLRFNCVLLNLGQVHWS